MMGKATVFRFHPMEDVRPYYQTYDYPYRKGMTVLDVLNLIRETIDPTLCYAYCCRNGHCGICGVTVDGKPVLSCRQTAEPDFTVEPLHGPRVLKDLVIDREEYESRHPKLRLFLERKCHADEEPERIDMQRFEDFKIASRCIECLCCDCVCPVLQKQPQLFAGPASFAQEARHFFDPRDELNRGLVVCSEGIEHCVACGRCSQVCGLGADPAGLIQKMRAAVSDSTRSVK